MRRDYNPATWETRGYRSVVDLGSELDLNPHLQNRGCGTQMPQGTDRRIFDYFWV